MATETVSAADKAKGIAELAHGLVFRAEQGGDLHEGPAKTADGELADMPRDLAHSLNSALFDVVALLYIARELAGDVAEAGPDDFRAFDGIHCRGTRLAALLSAADDKVRAVCKRLEPYV